MLVKEVTDANSERNMQMMAWYAKSACDFQGKGIQKTYWLVGRDGFNKNLPSMDN